MNNGALISVVIPVYNVEDYLVFCLESIINQTYKKLEIIIVDDGSTDKSGNIADSYSRKDPRIRVIHKKNGGLSDARNKGLDASKGEYICFIDSDDYVNYNYIEILYNLCVENKADISICSFMKTSRELTKIDGLENRKSYVIDGRDTIKRIYKGKGKNIAFTAWNKLYKRSLFTNNNIEYPKGRLYEDDTTTYRLFYITKKVAITEECLYYYRIRNNSIMTSKIDERKIKDGLYADICPIKFYKEIGDKELLSLSFNNFYHNTVELYKKLKSNDQIEMFKYVMDCYKKNWEYYHNDVNTTIIKKVMYYIFSKTRY